MYIVRNMEGIQKFFYGGFSAERYTLLL